MGQSGPAVIGRKIARHVLLVEDDLPLAKFIKNQLEADEVSVTLAHDGESAIESLNQSAFELLVLDLNLPKLDGLSVLRQIRPVRPRLPVLVLTGRNTVDDKVLSLESGADDCLTKPFSPVELKARVRALLRRNSGVAPKVYRVADLMLDREHWKVERNGRVVELSAREFAVLELLMSHAGQPLSRANILEQVWNIPFDPTTNVVDVYVKYVRDKIEMEGEKKLIRTIRSVGYMIAE